MLFWTDLHIPFRICRFLNRESLHRAQSFLELGFLATADKDVYEEARRNQEPVVILTRDGDFLELQRRLGSPPMIVRVKIGNSTAAELLLLLKKSLPAIVSAIESGAVLVEVTEQEVKPLA